MNWRARLGLAPGTSFGHFGHTYEPKGGSIHVPFPDQPRTIFQSSRRTESPHTAWYDIERDVLLLPRRSGRKCHEVPAAKFWGKYDGDFWQYRHRRMLELSGALRGRQGCHDRWDRYH